MYPDLTGRFSRLAGRADLLSRPYAARIGITFLAAAGLALMLAAAYQMIAYIRVPVDLLSFSESSTEKGYGHPAAAAHGERSTR